MMILQKLETLAHTLGFEDVKEYPIVEVRMHIWLDYDYFAKL